MWWWRGSMGGCARTFDVARRCCDGCVGLAESHAGYEDAAFLAASLVEAGCEIGEAPEVSQADEPKPAGSSLADALRRALAEEPAVEATSSDSPAVEVECRSDRPIPPSGALARRRERLRPRRVTRLWWCLRRHRRTHRRPTPRRTSWMRPPKGKPSRRPARMPDTGGSRWGSRT